MGDLKFILGFVAGWIATTKEGRETASTLANNAIKLVKEATNKNQDSEKAN